MTLSSELEDILYAETPPYAEGMLHVSDLHSVYWQAYGNKETGIPVICLHGGPGSGMSSWHPRLFDLSKYHVILLDQRGCGRSTPFAELHENTTQYLIADMEALRVHLEIENWNIFGGSWGATLALAYADVFPAHVRGLVMYGIFLCRDRELAAITDAGGPAAQLFPEYFEKFSHVLPVDQRDNIAAGYDEAFKDVDPLKKEIAIRNWCHWEMRIMDLDISEDAFDPVGEDMNVLTSLSLLEHHYFNENGFIDGDVLLAGIGQKTAKYPVHIIQGRYDLVCPPITAYELHKAIPHSKFTMIPKAGHTAKNVGTMTALLKAVDTLR